MKPSPEDQRRAQALFDRYLSGVNRVPCPNLTPVIFFLRWMKGGPRGEGLPIKTAAQMAQISRVMAYRWIKLLRTCEVDDATGRPVDWMFFRKGGRPPTLKFRASLVHADLMSELGRDPTAAELRERTGTSERYARMLSAEFGALAAAAKLPHSDHFLARPNTSRTRSRK